jgi:hypothetical protein
MSTLKNIVMPSTIFGKPVVEVSANTFENLSSSLDEKKVVRMSKNIRTIADNAFNNCNQLTVDIPNTIQNFGQLFNGGEANGIVGDSQSQVETIALQEGLSFVPRVMFEDMTDRETDSVDEPVVDDEPVLPPQ